MFIDIGFEKKMLNEYFMNLIFGQPKVLSIYQILNFLFAFKLITLLFIFTNCNWHLLTYIPVQYDSSGC